MTRRPHPSSATDRIINSSTPRLLCDISSHFPALAAHFFVPNRLHLRGVYRACPAFCQSHAVAHQLSALQLVIDKGLSALPRRQTDGATVIRCQDTKDAKARVFKLNATSKEPILVER